MFTGQKCLCVTAANAVTSVLPAKDQVPHRQHLINCAMAAQTEQRDMSTPHPLMGQKSPFLSPSQELELLRCSSPPLAQSTSAEYLENIKSRIITVRVIRRTARAWVTLSKKLYAIKEQHPGIKCFTCWFLHAIWVLAAGTSIILLELHLSNFSSNYLEAAWYQSK